MSGEDVVGVKFWEQRICKQNIANNGVNRAGADGREFRIGNPGFRGRGREARVLRFCALGLRVGAVVGTLVVHRPKVAFLKSRVKVVRHNLKILAVEKSGGR